MVNLKKCLLGELIAVTRGASLSGNYYSTKGEYIRLTCGNFDYRNNCFKDNTSRIICFIQESSKRSFSLKRVTLSLL